MDFHDGGQAGVVGELDGGPAVRVGPGGEDDVGPELGEGAAEGGGDGAAEAGTVGAAENLGREVVAGMLDGDAAGVGVMRGEPGLAAEDAAGFDGPGDGGDDAEGFDLGEGGVLLAVKGWEVGLKALRIQSCHCEYAHDTCIPTTEVNTAHMP